MKSNSRNLRIEWGDCDPAGLVYYPRYFEIFDNGTTYLIESIVGTIKREFLADRGFLGWPMVDTRASFSHSLRYGDQVSLESEFTEIGCSSFKVHHRLTKDGTLAVEGWETRVLVIEENGAIKSAPIPADLSETIRGS
ncbi:MAG: acyl-CoA thioesterase [Methylocystaceae bacterium]|nr:acyl-CoA thioesterase [Methylocystaceae bacterium]